MHRQRKRLYLLLIIFFALLFIIVAFWAYVWVALNIWIYKTPGELAPYERVLIAKRKIIRRERQRSDITKIERLLVEELTRDRIVIHLSRSEVRFLPFRLRAYVKIYMETQVPQREDRIVRVKLLEVLKRRDHRWSLVSSHNLVIQ